MDTYPTLPSNVTFVKSLTSTSLPGHGLGTSSYVYSNTFGDQGLAPIKVTMPEGMTAGLIVAMVNGYYNLPGYDSAQINTRAAIGGVGAFATIAIPVRTDQVDAYADGLTFVSADAMVTLIGGATVESNVLGLYLYEWQLDLYRYNTAPVDPEPPSPVLVTDLDGQLLDVTSRFAG